MTTFREDTTAFLLAQGFQLLYMSSRPGYSSFGRTNDAFRHFVDEMIANGIGLAVVLMTRTELMRLYGMDLCEFYRRNGMEVLHYPVEDGSTPEDLGSFHALMKRLLDRLKKSRILIHCNAGLGRTGTVAAGLLIFRGEKPDEAVAKIRRARQGAVQNVWQEDFLRRYFHAVAGTTASGGADEDQ